MFHHSSFSTQSFSPVSWRFDTAQPQQVVIAEGGWAPRYSKRVSVPANTYNLTQLHAEDREITELLMALVTRGILNGYGQG